MTPLNPVQRGAVSGASAGGSNSPSSGSATGTLLPPADTSALSGADPLSVLFFLEASDQSLATREGTQRVADLQSERDKDLELEKKAIADAARAAQHQSFWDSLGSVLGDVAKLAGVVVSIAAAVCTAGAAAPVVALAVAGAALSTATFVDGEFHILEKLGMDPQTAGWVDFGAGVAGCLCSFGAALAAGAGKVASAEDAVARAAKTADAAKVANAAGNAAKAAAEAKTIGNVVVQVGTVTDAVATAGAGVTTIAKGQAQSDAEEAAANEVVAESLSSHALRFIQQVIDEVEASDQQSERIEASLSASKETLNKTATIAASGMRA